MTNLTLDGRTPCTPHPWSLAPPSPHPTISSAIPMWLILCTCNFLHSGGWISSIRQPHSFELDFIIFLLHDGFFRLLLRGWVLSLA
ncbi:hypothetical protein RhiirA5_444174 [Rhizophagus irregularis]|uniref:Uncharacterized protein n=1 Tax=Rhizophagus irregularis TaxID=588596 RepID=A0A2N0NDC3_9GLOM|nr:hypothetical protein RhiirA5_444174 [Rhizophagus irregularis]GET49922.1 hypothetical protein RIR_e38658_A0A2N0NDC3_9GLOM [Rhizophagus irregularis DAOM 181602=DAOM 197198]